MISIQINRDGQEFGPYSPEELEHHIAAGLVAGSDLAWHHGMERWEPVRDLPAFAHLFPAREPDLGPGPDDIESATDRYLRRHGRAMDGGVAGPRWTKRRLVLVLGLGLFLFVVGGIALSTFLLGDAAERAAADLDNQPISYGGPSGALGLRARLTSYDRGFFASSARLRIGTAGSADGGAQDLPLRVEVHHGPVLLGSGGIGIGSQRLIVTPDREALPQPARDELAKAFGEGESILVTADIGFSGVVSGLATLSAFVRDGDSPGQRISFDGARAEFRAEPGGASLTLGATFGALDVAVGDGAGGFSSDGGSVTMRSSEPARAGGHPLLQDTEYGYDLPRARATFADSSVIELSGLKFRHVASTDPAGFYSAQTSISSDKVQTFGDSRQLALDGGFSADFALRDLHAEKFARISEMMEAPRPEGMDTGTEPDRGPADPETVRAILDLFQSGLRFDIGFDLASENESASVSFGFGDAGDSAYEEPATFRDALAGFESAAMLRFSKGILVGDAASEMLASFIENGQLADVGDGYLARVSLSAGELTFNGKSYPLPDEITSWLDEPIEPGTPPSLGDGAGLAEPDGGAE